MRVLIADDEPKIRQLLHILLSEAEGVTIVGEAANGKDALTLIDSLRPDLLITDIRMPVVDGLSLAQHIQEHAPETRVVIISGYSQFEYAKQAISYGVEDYLLKPIKKAELFSVLERVGYKQNLQRLTPAGEEKSPASILLHDPESLRGRLSREDLSSYMAPLPGEGSLWLVALIKVDALSFCDNRELLSLVEQKEAVIVRNMVLRRAGCACCLGMENGLCCLIVNLPGGKLPALQKALQSAIISIRALCENAGEAYVTAAVGREVAQPSEIVESFDSAQFTLENRLLHGAGRVLEGEIPTEMYAVRDFVTVPLRKTLLEHIERFEWNVAAELVRRVGQQVLAAPGSTGALAKRVALELAGLLVFGLHTELSDSEQRALAAKFESRIGMCHQGIQMFDEIIGILKNSAGQLNARRQEKEQRPIQLARQYIRQNYAQQLTLEEVAGVVGFTPSYFSALFKKETGQSFVEYLTEVRTTAARNLLLNTQDPIESIAEAVGYRDVKYFSKVFKKATELSPVEFRKLYC
ncbi:MAG: response regulator [Butyricicoccus sp.]